MEVIDKKMLIAFSGPDDSGKSVSLKNLILKLAQDERTKSCKVRLAKIFKNSKSYFDRVDLENVHNKSRFKEFLKNADGHLVDIDNEHKDDQVLFEECIERTFKLDTKSHEVDFVTLIEIVMEVKIKVAICTIGDDEEKIESNIYYDGKLKQSFMDADIVICACRSKGETIDFLKGVATGNNMEFLCIKAEGDVAYKKSRIKTEESGESNESTELRFKYKFKVEINILKIFLALFRKGTDVIKKWAFESMKKLIKEEAGENDDN